MSPVPFRPDTPPGTPPADDPDLELEELEEIIGEEDEEGGDTPPSSRKPKKESSELDVLENKERELALQLARLKVDTEDKVDDLMERLQEARDERRKAARRRLRVEREMKLIMASMDDAAPVPKSVDDVPVRTSSGAFIMPAADDSAPFTVNELVDRLSAGEKEDDLLKEKRVSKTNLDLALAKKATDIDGTATDKSDEPKKKKGRAFRAMDAIRTKDATGKK